MTVPSELRALQPCPFCNGEASLIIPSNLVVADCADVYVACDECEAQGQTIIVELRDAVEGRFPQEEAEAVQAWNQRNNASALLDEIEGLKRDRDLLIRDFESRAKQCRTNLDAFDTTAASVWDFAADAIREKRDVA